ncbi:MAG: DUF362 domain-containing protein [Deltaproteobacteria bacterium]|nr:DUF362 domain-containing protein [Deltaproteobacteria bacterium]
MKDRKVDRRDFLHRSARTAAALAAAGAAGTFAFTRRASRPPVRSFRAIRAPLRPVEVDRPAPLLAVVKRREAGVGPVDGGALVRRAIECLGGIERFVSRGDRVVVKPNVGWNRLPEQAANTNPELVGAVVALCMDAGAREVVVTDNTCNAPRMCFNRSGIRDAALVSGGKVVIPDSGDFVTVDVNGRAIERWAILRAVLDADRLINIPVAKQHGLAGYTGAMKNLYGIAGGNRGKLHHRLDDSIVDLTEWTRPTLNIVDGVRVLLDNGPSGGSLDDVVRRDTVIASTDPVAADALGCTLIGRSPDEIPYIPLGAERGLGELEIGEDRRVEELV